MPAYLPHCARYIEDGETIPRLMEISTDGIIKCCHNENIDSCQSDLLLDHFDCIVEIKCPYPNKRNLPVHYNLPIRYVTQILAGMKVKRTVKCLYIESVLQYRNCTNTEIRKVFGNFFIAGIFFNKMLPSIFSLGLHWYHLMGARPFVADAIFEVSHVKPISLEILTLAAYHSW